MRNTILYDIIKTIFFGNYFVGILAIGLCLEVSYQLMLPINNFRDYLVIFLMPIGYYTYAYLSETNKTDRQNPRSQWYKKFGKILRKQELLIIILISCILLISIIDGRYQINHIGIIWYVISGITFCGALFYYGLISKKYFGFDIRHTGWLKSFIIGWVWAYFSTILPVIFLEANQTPFHLDWILLIWFFIKNWMFCTVNAILFDIKDYPTDANDDLRTFVVSFGIQKTIYLILLPLLLAGIASFTMFSYRMNFSIERYLINLLPFIATIIIALSLKKPREILFYLIIIDGVLLFKACCGIIGSGL
ncbi:MAG: UbiA family prenyltransferase [Saprospiraceae bacterium]|nr:UbiA family prenyltransferase [Saprospiraceae bacterium]